MQLDLRWLLAWCYDLPCDMVAYYVAQGNSSIRSAQLGVLRGGGVVWIWIGCVHML